MWDNSISIVETPKIDEISMQLSGKSYNVQLGTW